MDNAQKIEDYCARQIINEVEELKRHNEELKGEIKELKREYEANKTLCRNLMIALGAVVEKYDTNY